MNRKTKVGFILLSVALMAVVALTGVTALLAGGSTEPASVSDSGRFKNTVQYTVMDAMGNIKEQKLAHNYTAGNILEMASDRLFATATVAAADLFANISACSTAQTGISADNGTATAACTLSSNIGTNPVLGTVTDLAENGNYTVVTTFTATGASTINELELSKNLVASTAPATGDIGAVKGVSIVLASGDTLQVTWTIDID